MMRYVYNFKTEEDSKTFLSGVLAGFEAACASNAILLPEGLSLKEALDQKEIEVALSPGEEHAVFIVNRLFRDAADDFFFNKHVEFVEPC